MRRRAPVVDRVSDAKLEDLGSELEMNGPLEDDEQFLGVAVRVRLFAGRPPFIELSDDHLQVLERPRREHELPAERAEGERRSARALEHSRAAGRPVWLEEIGDIDPESRRDSLERGVTGVGTPSLDLAQEAFGELGSI